MKGLKGLGGKLQYEGNNQKKTEEFRTGPYPGSKVRMKKGFSPVFSKLQVRAEGEERQWRVQGLSPRTEVAS